MLHAPCSFTASPMRADSVSQTAAVRAGVAVAAALCPPFWRRVLGLGDARGFPVQGGSQLGEPPGSAVPLGTGGRPPWLWELPDHAAGSKLCHERRGGGWPWGNRSQAQTGHRRTTRAPHSRLWLTAAADFGGIQKPPRHLSFRSWFDGPSPSSTSARRRTESGEMPCSASVASSSRWMLRRQQ